MRLLTYSLASLLLAVAAGVLLSRASGQVVVAFADVAVQTSLGFFVFMLVVCFILLYMIVRMTIGLLDLRENYRRRQRTRRHGKSEYYLTQGWLALTEGNWGAAEKLFNKGAPYSRMPVINYIGAARAAQQQGAIDRRDHYLGLASAKAAGPGYAVGITQAELQLDQQQTEQAYATLTQLDTDRPGKDKVRLMLLQASSDLKDWQQSLALLEEMEKKSAVPIEKIRAKQLQAWGAILVQAAGSGDVRDLNKAWDKVPKKLKKELYLIEVYISGRLCYEDTSDCEPLIRQVIRDNPDPGLVRLYGQVQGKDTDTDKQIALIEQLLTGHDRDSILMLTAGRLYKRQGLWGKARSWLEESIKAGPTAEAYYELATMLEDQADIASAGVYFRKGLTLAAGAGTKQQLIIKN